MNAHLTRRHVMLRLLHAGSAAAIAVGLGLMPASRAVSQDANANPTTYNIEIIVFRANSGAGGAENWSLEGGTNESSNAGAEAGAESTSPQVGHFVTLLPAAQYQLNDIESRLRSSGGYTP